MKLASDEAGVAVLATKDSDDTSDTWQKLGRSQVGESCAEEHSKQKKQQAMKHLGRNMLSRNEE